MTESGADVNQHDADPHKNGEHIDDLAAAYALGALDDDERRRVDHHLTTCAGCRQAVDDLLPGTTWLPFASPPAPRPSPAVKMALMARVDQQRQAAQPAAPATRRFALPRWGTTFVPAALAILLVASLLWSFTLSHRLTSAEHQRATIATQLSWLYSGQAGAQIYVFEPMSQNSPAGGRLCVNNEQTSAMVIAWALDPAQHHLLWAIKPDGSKSELMPLKVSSSGNVMQMVNFDSGYNGVTLMITTDGPESSMELMLLPTAPTAPASPATPTATSWPIDVHPIPLAY